MDGLEAKYEAINKSMNGIETARDVKDACARRKYRRMTITSRLIEETNPRATITDGWHSHAAMARFSVAGEAKLVITF